MRAHYFLSLLVFFILSGCASQATSLAPENVTMIQIEGCGLDGYFNERTSDCERELVIDEKQNIEVFLEVIEAATVYDGPLNTAGNNYVFTIIHENGEPSEFAVWLGGDEGSFEKSNEDDVRYFLKEGDDQKMVDIIESKMKKTP